MDASTTAPRGARVPAGARPHLAAPRRAAASHAARTSLELFPSARGAGSAAPSRAHVAARATSIAATTFTAAAAPPPPPPPPGARLTYRG
jgi:hypothetical protein